MKVLVVYGSKHGSTAEIASKIAEAIEAAGPSVVVHQTEYASDVAGYDAVVIGSAVYFGGWMSATKKFVEDNADALRRVPVWLYSSGPLGRPLLPKEASADGATLLTMTGAREHAVFAGRLEQNQLGVRERVTTRIVHASSGDFRDWAQIRAWGTKIGAEVAAMTSRMSGNVTLTIPTAAEVNGAWAGR
jgi:menaquinone-dependent protoporphyrinogen oxidase